jgi:predicted PurR-regulated permease PerM
VLLVTVLYFFLKDGPRMWEFLLRPFEGESYARGKRVGERTVSTFGSYLRGTALVALVDAVGIGIGLVILQVPLALPLVVLTFVLSFIPIVGAVLAGIVAALVALVALGPVQALIVVGIIVLVQQLESNILQPFLMGRTMRLNAFVVLIALAAGTVLGGILGAILAVPLTAAAWGVVQVWDGPDTPARWARRKRPEGDARDTLPNRVAQRSLDRPKAERAAHPKGA